MVTGFVFSIHCILFFFGVSIVWPPPARALRATVCPPRSLQQRHVVLPAPLALPVVLPDSIQHPPPRRRSSTGAKTPAAPQTCAQQQINLIINQQCPQLAPPLSASRPRDPPSPRPPPLPLLRLSHTRRSIDGFPVNTTVTGVTWKGNNFSGRGSFMGNSFTATGSANGNSIRGALPAARLLPLTLTRTRRPGVQRQPRLHLLQRHLQLTLLSRANAAHASAIEVNATEATMQLIIIIISSSSSSSSIPICHIL